MSLSVQRSAVESFNFNGKHVRSVYVKDVGQCLVSKDVYEAIGYNKESGVKAIERLVPEKYKIRFGDAQVDLEGVENPIHTQPNTMLLKKPDIYCLFLRCKKDEAEPFMEWVVETVLPQKVRKFASTIKEKDTVIALMNDGQIEVIKYENVALLAQKDVYQAELQGCQDTITHLKTRYVPHAENRGKDNIIIIVRKHTTSTNDKFHDLPYYVAGTQRRKRYVKLRWFDRHFPDHEIIAVIDNPNSIHVFNRFEEKGHAERRYNHFRLIDLTREELYAMAVPAILDDDEEEEE